MTRLRLCHDVTAQFHVPLTSAGFAYGNVVCWLSPNALCPDVHRPIVLSVEAVPDDRALLAA